LRFFGDFEGMSFFKCVLLRVRVAREIKIDFPSWFAIHSVLSSHRNRRSEDACNSRHSISGVGRAASETTQGDKDCAVNQQPP
jgi:hypothetical protein